MSLLRLVEEPVRVILIGVLPVLGVSVEGENVNLELLVLLKLELADLYVLSESHAGSHRDGRLNSETFS